MYIYKKMEEWRDIKGYENLYQISSEGRVRSLDRWIIYKNGRKRLWKGQILKPLKAKGNYWRVCLWKKHKSKHLQIHRLVAEAFIPNPDNLPQVNHIDKNIHNNSVSNLEFCTAQYNVEYSLAKPVLQYDKEGNLIKEWVSTKEIEKQLGFANTHISDCCRRKLKTAYGFIWCYKYKERAA